MWDGFFTASTFDLSGPPKAGPLEGWVGWLVAVELRCNRKQTALANLRQPLSEATSIADSASAHCFATPDFMKDSEPYTEARLILCLGPTPRLVRLVLARSERPTKAHSGFCGGDHAPRLCFGILLLPELLLYCFATQREVDDIFVR